MPGATLFTLETVQAEQGDCLLLHWGTKDDPQVLLIDGGPRGVYKRRLKERLAQLGPEDANVQLPLVVVSHIDSDHIVGVLDLLKDVERGEATADVKELWHNAFEKVVPEPVKREADAPGEPASLALASAPQGRDLDNLADKLSLERNEGFDDLVRADKGRPKRTYDGGLKLTVLAPDQAQLDALHDEWIHELEEEARKKRKKAEAGVTAYDDDSPANLSSIVILAEAGGKQMLLTGDARGDGVRDAVKRAKRSWSWDEPLDILKLPHHGSCRNVEPDFFELFPARHYVVSANGEYENPDIETLRMLFDVRKEHDDDDFTLWFTNQTMKKGIGAKVAAFLAKHERRGHRVVFRTEPAQSIFIDLLDECAPGSPGPPNA